MSEYKYRHAIGLESWIRDMDTPKAKDEVARVFCNLREENERLKSALRKVLSSIEHKFRHEEGIEEEVEKWYRDFGLKKEQGDE